MSEREDDLRIAAIVHACIPQECRTEANDPLLRLVPDGALPDAEQYLMAERITGKPFDFTERFGAIPQTYVWPARIRSHLTRWAIRQPGVHEDREHVRAREMWRVVTS